MVSSLARYLLMALIFVLSSQAASASATVGAEKIDVKSNCWAQARLTENPADVARQADRWSCGNRAYNLHAERIILRFAWGADLDPPNYLLARRSAMDGVQLVAMDADGTARSSVPPISKWMNSSLEGHLKIGLSGITPDTRQYLVAFDRLTHEMTLDSAHLANIDQPQPVRMLMFLAALCGMLGMPLVFNAAFYRVLREPFVIWHSVLVIMLLLMVLTSSGLAEPVLGLHVMTLSWLSTLAFGGAVAAGAMFTYRFIEPGLMHPLARRALPWSAALAVTLSILHVLFPYVLRPWQSTLYTAAYAPLMGAFLWALIDALRRGSRAAQFQAVGWAPMVVVGLTRLVTGLTPSLENDDAMLLFYFGCVFEVLATAMGVADRFMSLKDQRDRARTEAEILEVLAERDSLTGLLNRRVLEDRFGEFHADGYRTMAVLDLDNFKAINDAYGHSAGDEVLRATAEALEPNDHVKAFRMGGEEFILLLRGSDGALQAEARRAAIESYVASNLREIKRPVTASMGVMKMPSHSEQSISFDQAFARTDKLLYQAKSLGRDRAIVARTWQSGATADASETPIAKGTGNADQNDSGIRPIELV